MLPLHTDKKLQHLSLCKHCAIYIQQYQAIALHYYITTRVKNSNLNNSDMLNLFANVIHTMLCTIQWYQTHIYKATSHTHIIQICSGITSSRELNGELLYTKIREVNLFALANRLFHEDCFMQSVGKCKQINTIYTY